MYHAPNRLLVGTVVFLATLYSPVAAQKGSVTEQEVVFRSGSVELHGTLMTPPGQAHSPAVVFLHGWGPMTREGFRPYASAFAKLGIASLFFDKGQELRFRSRSRMAAPG
jgi:fermentation-respiration switch protein FrsA (DUF1100 family)